MSVRASSALVEAAALLLEAAGGDLFVTSLNKGLFYADLDALLHTGEAITGASYIALPAGPVVAKYQTRLVRALEDAGLAEQDDSEGTGKPLYLVNKPTRQAISDEHLGILCRVAAWAKGMTAKALSDYSHENPGGSLRGRPGLARRPSPLESPSTFASPCSSSPMTTIRG
jgi:hypothetical protein